MRNLAKFLIPLLLIPQVCFGAASRSFDGTNDNVTLASFSVTAEPVTMSCWFRAADVTNGHSLISIGDTTSASMMAGRPQGNVASDPFRAASTNAASAAGTADSSASYTANTWYFGTAVFASSSSRTAYLNAANSVNNTTSITQSGNDRLVVGERSNNETAQDMSGQVAYCMVHSRALNVVEIIQTMYLPGTIPDSQVVFWPLWGDSTEIDLSGNANTGTVTGATTSSEGPPVMLGGGLPL